MAPSDSDADLDRGGANPGHGVGDGLRLEHRGPLAVLTVDRPGSRNALTAAGHEALVSAWSELQRDPEVRAVVVTGAEDGGLPPEKQAFCAGFDVGDMAAGNLPGDGGPIPSLASVERRTPVVAAVNGHCIGAGMGMLFAADLRVASESATFGLPEVRLGTVPGNGSVPCAVEALPHPIAMEILLLGERIGAARALRHGLVNAVLPHEDVLAKAIEWGEALAKLDPEAVGAMFAMAKEIPDLSPSEAALLESETILRLARSDASEQSGGAASQW